MLENKKVVYFLYCALLLCEVTTAQVKMSFDFETPYGKNTVVGKFVNLNETKIYYEEYGKGEPLLLIHGNGGSIREMGNLIDFFKDKYRVIIADNRGQGQSELNTDSLTYEQITKDWEQLVNYLQLDSINIIGWSDGGIVGLKMGISGRTKVKKIVAMGANLRPDSTAVKAWAIREVLKARKTAETKIREQDTTQNWKLRLQLLGLLGNQPTIPTQDLSKVRAKVVIMAGDEDIIKNEHSLEMYNYIPKAQLCIMPGETHFTPASDPKLFNTIVDRFLSEPFKRPDSDWTKW